MLDRLLYLELFWVLLLALPLTFPGRFLPLTFQPACVLALFTFWPIRWLTWKSRQHVKNWFFPLQSALSLSVLLVLCWLPVNLQVSVAQDVAWVAAGQLALGIAVFVALINWAPLPSHLLWVAWVMVGLGALLGLLGPLLVLTEQPVYFFDQFQSLVAPVTSRLGETMNPNILAGALTFLIPFLLALALAFPGTEVHRQDKPEPRRSRLFGSIYLRVLLLVLTAYLSLVVALTQSRGGELAIIVAVALVFVLRWPKLTWALPVLLVVGAVAGARLGPAISTELFASGSAIGGLADRLDIWSRGLFAIRDFPFTGVGIGAFSQMIPLLYPYSLIPTTMVIPHAHNLLLQVAVDLGIPGLLAWLASVFNVVVLLLMTFRRRTSGQLRTLTAGMLGAVVAMLVHGLLDAPLWGSKLAFLPWVIFALAVMGERMSQHQDVWQASQNQHHA